LEGIVVKDRLVLVYSKNDMVSQLKQVSDPFSVTAMMRKRAGGWP